MERWAGKTAVVTGASAGIGAAVAVRLAECGLRVVGLARRDNLVQQLASKLKESCKGSITGISCDLTKSDDITRVFQCIESQHGGIDILVNNAGIFFRGNLTDVGTDKITDANVDSMINLNFRATVLCTRHAVASMNKRGVHGHIVNINSIAGHYEPFSVMFNIYPATKQAITAFNKALANEFAQLKKNIKVTSLSPGLVDTEMTSSAQSKDPQPALKPEDIAAAVAYAISTPQQVNISELTVTHVHDVRL